MRELGPPANPYETFWGVRTIYGAEITERHRGPFQQKAARRLR